jgi:hypothetical protein
MTRPDLEALREILHRASTRDLTVHPLGFELHPGEPLHPTVEARILGVGAARTRDHNRKPLCRSLDGVRPLSGSDRTCAECPVRDRCTPQVRLDLFVDAQPFRLLLAHSSAKNFLVYEAELRQRSVPLEHVIHRIDVINRGSWGELRFSPQPPRNR